jgi:thioredoxin reductase
MSTRPAGDTAPFPPGEYPVVVVGSGPGALQASYSLSCLGVHHAVISADEAPGGMFRRWPFFQRLLSWTKPYAPADHDSREYERYDWNSLLGDEPRLRGLQAEFMDGTSYFPARSEMEQNLAAFADRAEVAVRYGCRWTATRAEGGGFVLETTDGEYHCSAVVVAVGVAEPYVPPRPGLELCAHYAETRSAESYAGKRIFIAGKQNSAFELASGFLPWAQRIVLASPSPTRLSVDTKSLVGVRARYVQPYEDYVLGGGVSILDASIERVERREDGTFLIRLNRTSGGELLVEADEAIAATGFVTPLLDLPSLGVMTFGQSRLPAQTPFWESVSVPGIYFAGTITQGSAGLKKHGVPSNSGAVHGFRYNARLLARHLAEKRFGVELPRPEVPADGLVEFLVGEARRSPQLWHQKAYLARVVTVSDDGIRDEGTLPLAHVLDSGGPDAIVMTLEADGTGGIYPVAYLRIAGRVEEHALEPHPLLEFGTLDDRRRLVELVGRLLGSAAAPPRPAGGSR